MHRSPAKRPIEILLVEDSESDRLIAVEALAQARVLNNLHTVVDGVEAMAFLRRQGRYPHAPRPDLILLDLNLPRMDGREVLAAVKDDPGFATIPVIVLTTSADEEDVRHVYDLRANSYLRKPVDLPEFLRAIQSLENFWFEVVTIPTAPAQRRDQPPPPPAAMGRAELTRVLLIEDSPDEVALFEAALAASLSRRFELCTVPRVAEAQALLAEGQAFAAIVCDLALDDSSGLETVRRIRALAPTLPLIVLTAIDDEEMGIAALRYGAQDYLCRGVATTRLVVRTLRHAIDRMQHEQETLQTRRLELVGHLAGGIAHDFNNLLTAISGHASLLLTEDQLSPLAAESADEIARAVERASALTRQLLTFTRHQAVQRVWLDLNVIVGEVHKLLARTLGEDVTIELQLAGALPAIDADRGMMEQIVMNLAVNARDAMPAGGKLTLQTAVDLLEPAAAARRPQARPGCFVRLSAQDTGTGIPPEIVARIFDPFFTTKEPGKGTGLGLATVQRIVAQHEGWIEVSSTPGRGARFDVFFPAGEKAVGLPPPSERDRALRGSETLLFVEDEVGIRQVVTQMLGGLGYRVLAAADAGEAMTLWHQHAGVALLVTDIVMPGGQNGVDLGLALQALRPGLPVVYTSGYSEEFYGVRVDLVTGHNFLQKPYSLAELTKVIRRQLDGMADAAPHVA